MNQILHICQCRYLVTEQQIQMGSLNLFVKVENLFQILSKSCTSCLSLKHYRGLSVVHFNVGFAFPSILFYKFQNLIWFVCYCLFTSIFQMENFTKSKKLQSFNKHNELLRNRPLPTTALKKPPKNPKQTNKNPYSLKNPTNWRRLKNQTYIIVVFF